MPGLRIDLNCSKFWQKNTVDYINQAAYRKEKLLRMVKNQIINIEQAKEYNDCGKG
jgi:hypothetical protein